LLIVNALVCQRFVQKAKHGVFKDAAVNASFKHARLDKYLTKSFVNACAKLLFVQKDSNSFPQIQISVVVVFALCKNAHATSTSTQFTVIVNVFLKNAAMVTTSIHVNVNVCAHNQLMNLAQRVNSGAQVHAPVSVMARSFAMRTNTWTQKFVNAFAVHKKNFALTIKFGTKLCAPVSAAP
jgi:hypothetical protein